MGNNDFSSGGASEWGPSIVWGIMDASAVVLASPLDRLLHHDIQNVVVQGVCSVIFGGNGAVTCMMLLCVEVLS